MVLAQQNYFGKYIVEEMSKKMPVWLRKMAYYVRTLWEMIDALGAYYVRTLWEMIDALGSYYVRTLWEMIDALGP